MKVIVTTITRSPKGNPMRASREINAEQIRIGRGAECELRLADPRVPLHARSIFLGRNGPQLYEASEQLNDMSVTGVHRPQSLRPGDSVRIGPFQLEVVPHHDADLALTVELIQPLPGKSTLSAEELYAQARRAPVSKRALSWALFLGVLVFFLAIPVLNVFDAKPVARHAPADARLQHISQRLGESVQLSWNPGELSAGHQPFAADCRACHSDSFTRVQDKDCRACHQSLGDHVSHETKVAGLSDVRCADCHRDHKGALALQQQNTHYSMGECSACHGDIKAHMPATMTQSVSDFAWAHPEFRVSFYAAASTAASATVDKPVPARLRLSDKKQLVESRGLKFPHDVHLDPKGVKSPQGLVKTTCGSCHMPDSSGVRFKPVTMETHCQSCHELRFEIAAPERQVPHGDVDEVLATMRDYYSYLAINGIVLNRTPDMAPESVARGIPGKSAPAPRRLGNSLSVDQQVQASATEIFEKTTCFTCHDISRQVKADGTPTWKVHPVLPAAASWMPKAKFAHSKHDMASCESCHAAPASSTAQDVLMPDIASCRSCHAGSHPEPRKIVSNCGLCHGFHQEPHGPASLHDQDGKLPAWPSSRDAALLQAASAPAAGAPATGVPVSAR